MYSHFRAKISRLNIVMLAIYLLKKGSVHSSMPKAAVLFTPESLVFFSSALVPCTISNKSA
jgi:hypothetical protein